MYQNSNKCGDRISSMLWNDNTRMVLALISDDKYT